MKRKNLFHIIFIAILGCAAMSVVDGVIRPDYALKSVIKIFFFLAIPFIFSVINKELEFKSLFSFKKKGFIIALCLGLAIYGIILGGYFLLRDVFDFSSIASSLSENAGVDSSNFIFVSLYISFANSFLEEFFFRGFTFGNLKKQCPKGVAYIFSALAFALYHVAMMIGWFSLPLTALVLVGLTAGGVIFNYLSERFETIFVPWGVHMFANFAINTIGFLLLK
jgi:membrane protease YdiL (CAAX protease family)